jgi:hypothetical protein
MFTWGGQIVAKLQERADLLPPYPWCEEREDDA